MFDSASVRKLTAWVIPPELLDEEELLEDELLDEELLEEEELLDEALLPPPPHATSSKVMKHAENMCRSVWRQRFVAFIAIPEKY